MYDLILQLAVFLSLAVIILIMARVVPRISEDSNSSSPAKLNYFDRFLDKIPLNKLDLIINNFLSKILRRLKVVILKIDNFITSRLNKMLKKTNGNGGIKSSTENDQADKI